MKLLALFAAIVALVIGLAIAAPLSQSVEDWNDYQRNRHALDLAQRSYEFDKQRAWDSATFGGNVVFYYAAGLAALVLTGLILHHYAQAKGRQHRAFELTDFAGYPLPRAMLERGDEFALRVMERAIELDKVAKVEDARRALPPHTLTYAPKFSNSVTGTEPAALPSPAIAVPTFAELLDRGRVGKGNPLILGFDTASGTEQIGSWLDLYSTITAGMPGTGKTTTQRFLACQTALQGAKFAIIDPHASAADDSLAATLAPLSATFLCEPASSDKQILDVVRHVADIGRRRIDGKDRDTTPIILWADELTALLGRSTVAEPLAELLERIAQEYRKRHVFVSASGQIFTASRTTSELRDSFASAIVHRMKRNQARLILPTDEAQQVEKLPTGNAVLWRTSGATQTIVVPNTTAHDVRRVAALLADNLPTMPSAASAPVGRTPADCRQNVGSFSAAGSETAPSVEDARILAAFRETGSIAGAVEQIYGLNSKTGGSPYRTKRDQVEAVILRALVE